MHSEAFLARLHPDYRAALEHTPVIDMTDVPAMRRNQLASFRENVGDWSPSDEIERRVLWTEADQAGHRVMLTRFRPAGLNDEQQLPCLVWIHGGGHLRGSVELDQPMLEQLVLAVGCSVLAIEPRKAPEHPFPAPIDDCYAAVVHAFDRSGELGVDPRRIALGGASSGGGAAAAVCLMLRDRAEYPVVFQWLVYPMLDDRNQSESSFLVEDPRLWNRQANLIAWSHFLGDLAGGPVSPYAAPARMADLRGLPPTLIQTGELDLFRDEDVEYGRRLSAAGVRCEVVVYPGAVHGFERICPQSEIAMQFRARRDQALRDAFRI